MEISLSDGSLMYIWVFVLLFTPKSVSIEPPFLEEVNVVGQIGYSITVMLVALLCSGTTV